MNKELAKTLTLALVDYIDENRPEGTMDCSNTDCENIRAALEEGEYDCVEAFIQKKLSRLTEFEKAFVRFLSMSQGDPPRGIEGFAKEHSKELLALAKKELQPEIDAEIEKAYKTQDDVVFRKGWEQGKEEVLKDLEKTGKVHCKSYDKGFQDGETETMADLKRTYFNNPEKLPKWLKDDIARKELNAHTKGYNKGYEVATKLYDESVAYHFPIMPTPPSGWGCDGTHCTNPQMDCINCPRKTTGGVFSTSSGTSTATLHGNTSATDGKEHNPSFTD